MFGSKSLGKGVLACTQLILTTIGELSNKVLCIGGIWTMVDHDKVCIGMNFGCVEYGDLLQLATIVEKYTSSSLYIKDSALGRWGGFWISKIIRNSSPIVRRGFG